MEEFIKLANLSPAFLSYTLPRLNLTSLGFGDRLDVNDLKMDVGSEKKFFAIF